MPDMFLDVDVPISALPVNLFPITSSADSDTVIDALVYNASGLTLYWNFLTTSGQYSRTQIVPTSAGNYDWAAQGGGVYTIELPASGGASVNNDQEGTGWITGAATGCKSWVGPRVGFRSAALNGMLMNGHLVGPLPQFLISDSGVAQAVTSNTVQLRAASGLSVDDLVVGSVIYIAYASTGAWQPHLITDYVAATKTATISPAFVVTPTGSPEYIIIASPRSPTDSAALPGVRVDSMSANTVTASAMASDAIAEIQSGISAGTGITQEEAQAAVAAALAAYDPPTKAELDTAVAPLATAATLASINSSIASILQDTGTDIPALIAALNNVSVAEILTTQMTQSYAANGVSPTLAQCLFAIQQHLMEFTISGNNRTVRQLDGATTAFVETIERDGNGLAVGLSR